MSIQRYILFFESQIFLETFIHKTGYSCGHIFGIHARQPFPVAHARVAGPEQERFACPSTRSGCAVPCGASLHALAWHFARHQAVAKRKQGRILCDGFAQRQGLGWNPSMDSCPDLQTLRFAHREGSNLHFVLKTWHFCG